VVIIDPVTVAFETGGAELDRRSASRLQALADLAARHRVAVLACCAN
jgi:hypothetical protein